jgi:antibiotic biosynthesis monooxygenase (ABM) superfamily enzyme
MADRVVTISVSYPVTPGEEGEFEVWSRLRLAETADRPGYLGGQVLAPPAPGPDWFIVHRFENERAASDWESWFRGSPGWQQAGDIEWKFDRPGEPARGGADRRRSGADGAGARRAAVLPQRPYTAAPDARPPEQRNGPNGARRPTPPGQRGGPPAAVAVATPPPGPPRPAGPPPIESRPRPQNGAARSTPPAAPPAEPPPSQAASIVVTIAVIVLFTAVFETVVAPLLAGGPILLRIVLLSVVITLAVTAVRPPGLRRWLANLLVPVAVRRRNEDGRDQPR